MRARTAFLALALLALAFCAPAERYRARIDDETMDFIRELCRDLTQPGEGVPSSASQGDCVDFLVSVAVYGGPNPGFCLPEDRPESLEPPRVE